MSDGHSDSNLRASDLILAYNRGAEAKIQGLPKRSNPNALSFQLQLIEWWDKGWEAGIKWEAQR